MDLPGLEEMQIFSTHISSPSFCIYIFVGHGKYDSGCAVPSKGKSMLWKQMIIFAICPVISSTLYAYFIVLATSDCSEEKMQNLVYLDSNQLGKKIIWEEYSQHLQYISSVQSLGQVQLFVTPWTAAHQASLSITNSWSLLKLKSLELVMPSNHLILCHPPLFLPSSFCNIRVNSSESVLRIRLPK